MPPRAASSASVRSTPSGMTPVPEGASLPMMIRCVARAAVATRSVWSAVFTFPHWTISTAMSVATSRSISAGASEVVPPLMWPTTSGLASRTTSASMGLEPAIEGPPVWIVTVIPCALAQRTIGAASLPVLTEPSPISPTSVTPAAGQVHLPRRDRGRDAAVHHRVDEVDRALARREVAEHRVDVGVDEARQHRRPMGVDHGVRVVVEPAAEPDDRSVPDHQRVAVQERAPDVPAHELADVSNERLHTLRYALRRARSASRRANGPSNLICPFSMM